MMEVEVLIRILPFALLALAGPCASHAETQIDWRVEHPFRLVKSDNGAASKIDEVLKNISSSMTISGQYENLIRALAVRNIPDSEKIYLNTYFNRELASYDPSYIAPKSQAIVLRLAEFDPAYPDCIWTIDGVARPSQSCADEVPISVPVDQAQFRAHANVSVQAVGGASYEATIDSHDSLVLVLGDSYAAGEGNPDLPANLSGVNAHLKRYASPTDWWHPFPVGSMNNDVLKPQNSADWWSNECHRSLFSPQVLAAMRMAAADPHRSVTLVSFACSGAAVLDGFLTPQKSPPGKPRLDALHQRGLAQESSQLAQAVSTLCLSPTAGSLPYTPADFPTWHRIYSTSQGRADLPSTTCGKWIRKPDVILITLGGNDVGFAGMGAWALLPVSGPWDEVLAQFARTFLFGNGLGFVCPSVPFTYTDASGAKLQDTRCKPGGPGGDVDARHLIEFELPALLKLAAQGLSASGLSEQATVIQVAYPSAFNDAARKPCGTLTPGSAFGKPEDLEEEWRSLDVLIAHVVRPKIESMKTEALRSEVIPALNNQIAASAAAAHWLVAKAPTEYEQHGFCAGSSDLKSEFGFPQVKLGWFWAAKAWDGSYPEPRLWDPYSAGRARWLRNANDSVLTQMVSDKDGVVLPESLSGMFHPTARGDAAIADRIYAALSSVAPASSPTLDNSPQSGPVSVAAAASAKSSP